MESLGLAITAFSVLFLCIFIRKTIYHHLFFEHVVSSTVCPFHTSPIFI